MYRVGSLILGRGVLWFLAFAAAAACAWPLLASSPAVTRVEEDWELVIGTPSPKSDAPQVTCLISPFGNANSYHSTFVVNYHDNPSFVAGGLQLQTWNGETSLESKRAPNQAVLSTPGETIRWTQAMQKTSDGVTFEVVGGSSTTWGEFGNDGSLRAAVSFSIENLNGYSPEVSVKQSGVSYASNRVQSLILKRVRVYGADGLIAEDTTPRVVHTLSQ